MIPEPGVVTFACQGWWHPNVKSGQVHEHTAVQPQTMHRLCEPVYTRRDTPRDAQPGPPPG